MIDPAFVYEDHGKNDPFRPLVSASGTLIAYDADIAVNDMILEGIVADTGGNNLAIINGKVVKVSDKLGAYQIQSISSDQVELIKDEEHFMLKLNKGGS